MLEYVVRDMMGEKGSIMNLEEEMGHSWEFLKLRSYRKIPFLLQLS